MRTLGLAVSIALLAAAAACSSGNAASPGGGSTGASPEGGATSFPTSGTPLPCDVDDVLARNCRTCHQNPPKNGAPMPLDFLESLRAPSVEDPSKPVYVRVGERIHDDARPMPQPPNPRLDAKDTATLDAWIAKGAPAATTCAADGGAQTSDGGGPPVLTSCTPDLHLAPATRWSMPQTTDDQYVCYGVDVPVSSKRQVIAIAPKIDNTTIVHHVLLYEADASASGTPTPCSAGGLQNRLVYAWAPGGEAMELPPQAGFAEEGTTHWVVQVHYSNLNHLSGQTDASGFDLCTTDQLRPNDADVLAFGTMSFTIPARGSTDLTCNESTSLLNGIHMFSAFPHMHKLGTAIATTLTPAGGGATVDLGHASPWNFGAQLWYPIDATLHPGDVVKTRCAWTNPGDKDVTFGQTTSDEMCYGFVAYYPKIQSAQWSWALPALHPTCAPSK